jgi:hypothetical protein
MNEEIKTLLEAMKEYIESMEVKVDWEWGSCRELEELQSEGLMPELYTRVVAVLDNSILNNNTQQTIPARNGPDGKGSLQ